MMSDRVIRDELLDSDRYINLSSDSARLMFIHLVLNADCYGNVDGRISFLRRRVLTVAPEDAVIWKWVAELHDNGLVIPYEVDGQKYLHIPRFRQRVKYQNPKYPRPPANIECKEIRELISKKAAYRQSTDRPQSDSGQPTDGPQAPEVKRSEVKRSEVKRSSAFGDNGNSDQQTLSKVTAKSTCADSAQNQKPKIASDWFKTTDGIDKMGRALGMLGRNGETYPEFQARISAELRRRAGKD